MKQFNKKGHYVSLQSSEAVVVVPSDSTEFEASSLYVGVTGNVKVDMVGVGTAIVFTAVPAGTFLSILVTRVYTTDTTATNIVRLV